jgi:hypothetical protein
MPAKFRIASPSHTFAYTDPSLRVCLDCGSAEFTVAEIQLPPQGGRSVVFKAALIAASLRING